MQIILASNSPRRKQLLSDLGAKFQVCPPEIDESRLRGEPAAHYVQRLAKEKANASATSLHASLGKCSFDPTKDWVILAADTTVVLGKSVLNKPESKAEAFKMLRKLSGRSHEVMTGYYWLGSFKNKSRNSGGVVRTKVSFAAMPDSFWKWYIETGEPMDKAGAYAAQGIGLTFIEKVSGSYSNVVGLPMTQILTSFKKTFGRDFCEFCG